jgi:hypothetical protein
MKDRHVARYIAKRRERAHEAKREERTRPPNASAVRTWAKVRAVAPDFRQKRRTQHWHAKYCVLVFPRPQ